MLIVLPVLEFQTPCGNELLVYPFHKMKNRLCKVLFRTTCKMLRGQNFCCCIRECLRMVYRNKQYRRLYTHIARNLCCLSVNYTPPPSSCCSCCSCSSRSSCCSRCSCCSPLLSPLIFFSTKGQNCFLLVG